MKNLLYISLILILGMGLGCKSNTTQIDSNNEDIEPRIQYVIYGTYCGECSTNCTKMYKQYLTGNKTTLWKDTTDSYFESNRDIQFNKKMDRIEDSISSQFVNQIPKSIFKTKNLNNVYGCPDCNDGCGILFEFKLDENNAQSIIYRMDYSLEKTSGDVKKLGELIKQTIEKINQKQ